MRCLAEWVRCVFDFGSKDSAVVMCKQIVVGDDPESEGVRLGVEVMARGGIVVYPTDTLYGLGVDPTRRAAVERLSRLSVLFVGLVPSPVWVEDELASPDVSATGVEALVAQYGRY